LKILKRRKKTKRILHQRKDLKVRHRHLSESLLQAKSQL
jgi:hypothetical protein